MKQEFSSVCGLRVPGTMVRWGVTWLIPVAAMAGCKDAAEADFKKCEQLEKEGKLEEAATACHAAQQADPRSPYGEKALKLESKLYDKIAEQKKERETTAAAQGEEEKVQDAESKVQWELVSTPPKDPHGYSERCMARNRAYENSYNCVPKDSSNVDPSDGFPFKQECMFLAERRGCLPFYEESPTKLFCCTK